MRGNPDCTYVVTVSIGAIWSSVILKKNSHRWWSRCWFSGGYHHDPVWVTGCNKGSVLDDFEQDVLCEKRSGGVYQYENSSSTIDMSQQDTAEHQQVQKLI